MSYDKELLKRKLQDFMGSSEFSRTSARQKTGLCDSIIKKIINHDEIATNKNNHKKIFELFGVNVLKLHENRHFDFQESMKHIPDETIITLLKQGLDLSQLAQELRLNVSEYHLAKTLFQRKIIAKIRQDIPKFKVPFSFDRLEFIAKKEIITPKRFRPLTMGGIDPLKNFDLKAELKKVRENQSR